MEKKTPPGVRYITEKNAFCFVMVYDEQDILAGSAENQYVVSTLSKEVNIISRNKDNCCDMQTHVHEILGSVEIAGREPHTHRFAAVSGEAIYHDCDHVHDVMFRTDFYEGHFHEFCGRTCGAIEVGDRHVHFLECATSVDAGHCHDFRVATLIEDPTGC